MLRILILEFEVEIDGEVYVVEYVMLCLNLWGRLVFRGGSVVMGNVS